MKVDVKLAVFFRSGWYFIPELNLTIFSLHHSNLSNFAYRMNSLIVTSCYKDPVKKSDRPNEKNFTAVCKCCPAARSISGNINSTSSLLKHIQERHRIHYKQFNDLKVKVGSRKRKHAELVDEGDWLGQETKRQQLLQLKPDTPVLSQTEFDGALCSMITTDMMPLATIERKGFITFCAKVAPQCVVMNRRQLGREVSKLYTEEKQKLISALQNAEFLSATTDAWRSHKWAIMRWSCRTLGVRRCKHAHTGEAIAKILLSMLNEFGIRSKVQ